MRDKGPRQKKTKCIEEGSLFTTAFFLWTLFFFVCLFICLFLIYSQGIAFKQKVVAWRVQQSYWVRKSKWSLRLQWSKKVWAKMLLRYGSNKDESFILHSLPQGVWVSSTVHAQSKYLKGSCYEDKMRFGKYYGVNETKIEFDVQQRRKTFLNASEILKLSQSLVGQRQFYYKRKIKCYPRQAYLILITQGFPTCKFAYSLKFICIPLKIQCLCL